MLSLDTILPIIIIGAIALLFIKVTGKLLRVLLTIALIAVSIIYIIPNFIL